MQGVIGVKSKTKLILEEMQKLFNGEVDAFEFSCYFSKITFENYDELEENLNVLVQLEYYYTNIEY